MQSHNSSNAAELGWQAAPFFFTLFLSWTVLLLFSGKRFQSVWYLRPVMFFISFYLTLAGLNIFIILFLFRYTRLAVHLIAFRLYKPVPVSDSPKLTPLDVTVIVPTVDPWGKDFMECIDSIYANGPASIIVVTAGHGAYKRAVETLRTYSNVLIEQCEIQSKREQICKALPKVSTKITILCDDHVFWPKTFLPSILAPFDNGAVGCVGTNKRVRRDSSKSFFSGYWNFLGCLYLERLSFDAVVTNTIDGGVPVLSGRTSAHRSDILKSPAFRDAFTNEYIFFGLIGPLNADDDNFITRWMVNHGWEIKIQHSEAACIETTQGEFPKFLYQCMRWARTTWRSNPRSLISSAIWKGQPWCIYAVFLTSFVNFALFYDALLVYTLFRNLKDRGENPPMQPFLGVLSLTIFILATKLVKIWPHFRRYPRDWYYFPGYILFAYYHSLIKLWALLTFWDIQWGSRPLKDGEVRGGRV